MAEEVNAWPEEVKAFLPTEPVDAVSFRAEMEKLRPLVSKLAAVEAAAPQYGGNSVRGPKPGRRRRQAEPNTPSSFRPF